jgi:hypothetical protein
VGKDTTPLIHNLKKLNGDGQSTSCPDHFTLGKKSTTTNYIGGWVSPTASPDVLEEGKIPSPYSL